MIEDLKRWMIAQALCDSLNLRSTGEKYFIYESFGVHYVAHAYFLSDRKEVEVVTFANSYNEIINVLLEILEERIAES